MSSYHMPDSEVGAGRAASVNVPRHHSPIEERLEHMLQLVVQIPHFCNRLEDVSARISGPLPTAVKEGNPALYSGTSDVKMSLYQQLDHITTQLESAVHQLADVVDRVDGSV